MTTFADPKSIFVAERQRKDYGDLSDMEASVKRHGIIQPIIVAPRTEGEGLQLVAGGRRLQTALNVGLADVPVRLFETLGQFERLEIELEENIKRKDLTWQEECRAVLDYHDLRCRDEVDWTSERTAVALNLSAPAIYYRLSIAREAVSNPDIWKASGISAAFGSIRRRLDRAVESELNQLLEVEDGAGVEDGSVSDLTDTPLDGPAVREMLGGPASSQPAPNGELQPKVKVWNANSLEILPLWEGRKFNLIHCDFPYGLKMDTSALQGTRSELARYADSPDLYWSLTKALLSSLDRIAYPSCHVVFWFSMNFYTPTVELLTQHGLVVNPFPLIWDKADGRGILPDPERGPRRTYETALLCSRGDRKIVKAVKNSISLPTDKAEAEHLSEKPLPMLKHFLSMLVDETTELLDPTAGSGTALVAAMELGARKCLGIEIDPDHCETIKRKVSRSQLIGGLVV